MNPFASSPSGPPPLPAAPPRSLFVTIFAWIVIGLSAVITPISFISLLMVLVGSYGTANADPLEGLVVIAGPPVTLIAGIGLLRRWRWAYGYILLVLVGIAAWSSAQIIRGPSPARTYTSPAGVPTTVMATTVDYPFHGVVIAVCVGALVKLLTPSVRAEFAARGTVRSPSPPATGVGPAGPVVAAPSVATGLVAAVGSDSDPERNWRVGHQGRDCMYYEERCDGGWQRIEISGEMLMGRAHHVIYFAGPTAWQNYPAWARHRRDEIIARIKSEFRAPDYEYAGDVVPPARVVLSPLRGSASAGAIPHGAPAANGAKPARPKGWNALVLVVVILLGISGGMFWLVQGGIARGEIPLPTKLASQGRGVSRVEQPALFWASAGIYAVIGVGTLGLAAWGVREAFRGNRSSRR